MKMTEGLDRETRPVRTAPRSRRRMVLLGAGMLAFVLATTGVVAAVVTQRLTEAQPRDRSRAAQTSTARAADARKGSPDRPSPSPSAAPSPTVDPTALADGIYPAFIRDVDVRGNTITVDVIQLFEQQAAVDAAVDDGISAEAAQLYLYAPVYVRNENPLLRTLPVARDVSIEFLGGCEAAGNRHAELRELSERTSPFDSSYYYAFTLRGGAIERVVEHIAVSAC
jgi:hypothetical protein